MQAVVQLEQRWMEKEQSFPSDWMRGWEEETVVLVEFDWMKDMVPVEHDCLEGV